MALPAIVLKAKGAISKGAQAINTVRAVKSASSNSNEEEVKSIFGILKVPLMIVVAIAGTIAAFIFVVFIAIVAIPQVLIGTIFGGGSLSDNIGSSSSVAYNAQAAIELAESQLGVPYGHGNVLNDNLDCNGLTYYAWKAAGVNDIPLASGHYGYGQYQWAQDTGRFFNDEDELQPGDIVFWGNNNHNHNCLHASNNGLFHVGLYIGNGEVIHSYGYSTGVIKTSIDLSDGWFIGGAHLNVGGGTGYIQWAINIANDDSHGYSQCNRNGPDYDCSSLVWYSLINSGYSTNQLGDSPFSTATMPIVLPQAGFVRHNFVASELQAGDILWRSGHTAMYIGNNQIVHAAGPEGGGLCGAQGDQTGKEILVQSFSTSGSWTAYYRKA